ncbi:uncharacterized protein [Procambarus clarkii]|uniref:uncharacterized protein n=1 Tax=Procambarus clarkii TaxID=6728 RepID=UPI001E67310C|nr:uncharacterized protein LOC123774871 [Procambarus clarkii]
MCTSQRLLILCILGVLSEGRGSPVARAPAGSYAGEASLQFQHPVSRQGAASLLPHLTHVSHPRGDEGDARGTSIHLVVADRTDADKRHALLYAKTARINTVVTHKEAGSYLLDGSKKLNNTELYIALGSLSNHNAKLTPFESYNTVGDKNILRRSVRNESSGQAQDQTDVNYRTLRDTTQPSKAEIVAKCCGHNQYMAMDGYACVLDDLGLSLLQDPLVRAASITQLTYTSFPTCESGEGYHFYYVDPRSVDDHGELMAGQVLEVVSMEGECVLSRRSIHQHNYCLEYGVDGSDIRPIVLVCPEMWENTDVHRMKYGVMAALLGVSCIAFFATAVFLVSSHARRGLVTVRKVKTLAGRLQLSYVLTSLVGFLLLAASMTVEVAQDSSQCYAMAGLLTFFLLAGFQWNTSICLEALIASLRFGMFGEDEGWRYILHSLWAWGVPGLITSLALTLNHYRASLPCSVITPRIGLYNCFFSDQKAKLVYLYVPMLLTLCANTFLLLASRCVRSANLRRMDYCITELKHKPTPTSPSLPGSDGRETPLKSLVRDSGGESSSTSGPRQHQGDGGQPSLHPHNLWRESVLLVVWSGATWFMEVVAFLVAQYVVQPSTAWYDYLWYIPSSVNALRGVGIFCILVLTSENRGKLSRATGNLGRFLGRSSSPADSKSSLRHHQSPGNEPEVHGRGSRIMSIATTITQLSIENAHSLDSGVETASESTATHPRLTHSVSQVDNRCSSASSVSSDFGDFELDAEVGGEGETKVTTS